MKQIPAWHEVTMLLAIACLQKRRDLMFSEPLTPVLQHSKPFIRPVAPRIRAYACAQAGRLHYETCRCGLGYRSHALRQRTYGWECSAALGEITPRAHGASSCLRCRYARSPGNARFHLHSQASSSRNTRQRRYSRSGRRRAMPRYRPSRTRQWRLCLLL